MILNLQNKLITACLAIVVALALALTFAGIVALLPNGSLLGFIIRAACLAGVVPIGLLGFNALCDMCTQPHETTA